MTYEAFIARFPEFNPGDGRTAALVKVCLAAAARELSTSRWATHFDDAHAEFTGDMLWRGAFGVPLRMEGATDKKSPYQIRFETLVRKYMPRAIST